MGKKGKKRWEQIFTGGNALPRPQALPGPFSALPSASSYSSKAQGQGLYKGALPSNKKILYTQKKINNKGVCHTVALPFTVKSILRQKKNYGNPLKETKILQDIITL